MVEEERQETFVDKVKFLFEKSKEDFCNQIILILCISNSAFSHEKDCFLVRSSKIYSSIQKPVLVKFRERMLHLSHYPILAGLFGGLKMYDTMKRSFYWPQIAEKLESLPDRGPSGT